jgi:ectoine hydroxylase-related dioxygenase (phytanoyl-CoA dioxygenase family)
MSASKTGSLSQKQIQRFDQQGYLHLSNCFDCSIMQHLRDDADRVASNSFVALKNNTISKDHAFTLRYFKTYLNRITSFHLYADAHSLSFMGCPQVLAMAQSLCGRDVIPTVDMLILKNQGDELDLPWHQDLIYNVNKFRVIAVGIYLDDAVIGQGALKFISNSQHQKHDIQALVDDKTNEIIEIPAKAGDIVIHNPMLVHCSDKLIGQVQRRTLYYEFRPIQQVIEDGHWQPKVIKARQDLLNHAINAYHQNYCDPLVCNSFCKDSSSALNQRHNLSKIYRHIVPTGNANFSQLINEQLIKSTK